MNGYFQIQINQNGVSIILSPPIGEGEKIRAGELKEYLDRIGVPYDTKAINSALHDLGEEEVALFLSPMKLAPVDEKCTIDVGGAKALSAKRGRRADYQSAYNGSAAEGEGQGGHR